ncbi:zinc finger protein 260-like [Uranotaenia lowii]|uniref:zinc finger protein 260-like n=1 Tax=Uranotaenia lowii TaxID=190385 RepID=UPI002478A503|nr:zinc finger protein 260-like [Uranotaenia lowii]XP_055597775.1 zinc finger protein 260-like [Uranotaenia lowii]
MSTDICRVCMDGDFEGTEYEDSERKLIPIFSKLEDVFIANIVAECTAIEIEEDDGLPAVICRGCVDDLKYFIAFIRKARETDHKLRKIFKAESDRKDEDQSIGEVEQLDEEVWDSSAEAFGVMVEVKAEEEEVEEFEEGTIVATELDRDDEEDFEAVQDNDSDYVEPAATVKRKRRGRPRKRPKDSDDSDDSDSPRKAKVSQTKRGPGRPRKILNNSDDEFDDIEKTTFEVINILKGKHLCCSCLQIFDCKEQLAEHGEEVHSKKRAVNLSKTNLCLFCHRRYSTPYALKQHIYRTKTAKRVYTCSKCPARFIDKVRRRKHAHDHPREREINSSKGIVQEELGHICCAQACYMAFQTEDMLIAHAHSAHKINKVEQSLDENRDKPFECQVCFKRFYDELTLQRHQQRNYKSLSHQCTICGLKMRGGELLANHERSHRNEKPFECETCHKYFSTKGSLKAHMMIHSGEKPFSCTICGWSFRRKRNLQVHALSHTNNQPFQCEVCQKTFKAKVHLQYHMRTHTGEKPYPCRFCEKAFADHTNRQRHEISHTGIKPYKCSYCDKTFIRKRFQVDHESTHTGVKPYRCEMCNRTFSQKSALRRHLESHPLATENATALSVPSPMEPSADGAIRRF